jgi:ABC-2 type transport system permease protein
MELYALVNGPDAVRRAMLNAPFGAWHGLAAEPRFYGPLVEGAAVSVAYLATSLAIAYTLFARRDVGS